MRTLGVPNCIPRLTRVSTVCSATGQASIATSHVAREKRCLEATLPSATKASKVSLAPGAGRSSSSGFQKYVFIMYFIDYNSILHVLACCYQRSILQYNIT